MHTSKALGLARTASAAGPCRATMGGMMGAMDAQIRETKRLALGSEQGRSTVECDRKGKRLTHGLIGN